MLKSLALRLSSLSLNLALKPLTGALGSGLEQLFSGHRRRVHRRGAAEAPSTVREGRRDREPDLLSARPAAGSASPAKPGPKRSCRSRADPTGGSASRPSGGAGANVTVNIATPDAESFRRSETYLTGLIARAVARGQRGL